MTLDQLVNTVESRLAGLGRLLWRPDPREQRRQEAEDLAAELRDRNAALARCRDQLDSLRRRLGENQAAAALLPSQVEACLRRGHGAQAWSQALELDRIRQAV